MNSSKEASSTSSDTNSSSSSSDDETTVESVPVKRYKLHLYSNYKQSDVCERTYMKWKKKTEDYINSQSELIDHTYTKNLKLLQLLALV